MATRKKREPRFKLQYVLICEEIRPELGGKMTLIGFYGSDTILVGAEIVNLRGLGFLFAFDHVHGKSSTSAKFRLERSDGEPVLPELTLALAKGATLRKNVIIQLNGVEFRTGKYLASLTLDADRIEHTFDIKCDPEFIARLRAAQDIAPG